MEKFKYALYRFMSGRYGNDTLNIFLLGLAIVLALLNIILFQSTILTILTWIVLGIQIFRCYSRKIYKRQVENAKFLKRTEPIRKYINLAKNQSKDKEHKLFLCPNCKKTVRVPKGKGKITITCPICKTRFDRKS